MSDFIVKNFLSYAILGDLTTNSLSSSVTSPLTTSNIESKITTSLNPTTTMITTSPIIQTTGPMTSPAISLTSLLATFSSESKITSPIINKPTSGSVIVSLNSSVQSFFPTNYSSTTGSSRT
jgi:hypothetical protein